MFLGRSTLRPIGRVLGALGVWAALASCGGGTSQVEPFKPERYIAFGDETSAIASNGLRYTVNPVNDAGVVDCAAEPIWVQTLANQYGFVFSQCNPSGSTTFNAVLRAVAGSKADDVKVQVDQQVAAGGFGSKDLVTVLSGVNDIVELYAKYPAQTEEALTAEARARGQRLAEQVNRMVELGARVIVATIPDVGLTPFGVQQKAAFTDTDRAALLTRLTAAYNGRIRTTILNDGRFVGLILTDELSQAIVRTPSLYAVTNATTGACAQPLPDCTSKTLVEGGSSTAYLWADALHFTYAAHQRLGTLAVARATGNPF